MQNPSTTITARDLAAMNAVLDSLWNGQYHGPDGRARWTADLKAILKARCAARVMLTQAGLIDVTVDISESVDLVTGA